MIHVIDVQSRATIQDLGRFGLRRFGISHCGAMDKLALRAGNILLGNAEGAPAIEVPLSGITLQFHQDMNFCVTGAFYEMTLDDKPVFAYWRYQARAGQVLKMVRAKIGMYGYLCVEGGFILSQELNSCSTDLRAQIESRETAFPAVVLILIFALENDTPCDHCYFATSIYFATNNIEIFV